MDGIDECLTALCITSKHHNNDHILLVFRHSTIVTFLFLWKSKCNSWKSNKNKWTLIYERLKTSPKFGIQLFLPSK